MKSLAERRGFCPERLPPAGFEVLLRVLLDFSAATGRWSTSNRSGRNRAAKASDTGCSSILPISHLFASLQVKGLLRFATQPGAAPGGPPKGPLPPLHLPR